MVSVAFLADPVTFRKKCQADFKLKKLFSQDPLDEIFGVSFGLMLIVSYTLASQ